MAEWTVTMRAAELAPYADEEYLATLDNEREIGRWVDVLAADGWRVDVDGYEPPLLVVPSGWQPGDAEGALANGNHRAWAADVLPGLGVVEVVVTDRL